MKKLIFILAVLFTVSACKPTTTSTEVVNTVDSTVVAVDTVSVDTLVVDTLK